MRIKVLGNGGRENAIRWKLRLHGHEVDVTYPELTIVSSICLASLSVIRG